jgi:hypothetical protein
MSRKFWFGFIGLVALLSLVLIISRQLGRPAVQPADNLINDQQSAGQPGADLTNSTSVNPVLAQAQPAIKLPTDSEFMVSGGSATATIRFIEGSIKPLDVHVGDTQHFRIVVTSPNGIKRVVAEIETDNGIHEVELTREGLVGIMDTYPNPYVVNPQDNTLQILSQSQLAQARLDEQKRDLARQKTNQANAADGQREVWTGSWVVNDVHNKTYFTNFIAYDSAGNQDKLTMTWSDLCGIPLSGSWTSDSTASGCTISMNYTDGVDNGTATLAQYKNLNLSTGATFVWNPGQSVVFDGGKLILAANRASQLKQSYLYVHDRDQDRYSLPAALSAQTSSDSAIQNYTRRNNLLNQPDEGVADCNDQNEDVLPGTLYYYTATFTNEVHPDLVYDWNCNGTVELNPDTSLVVNSGTSFLDEGYIYRTCKGFDIGGCCGVTQSKPDNLLAQNYDWHFVHPVRAEVQSCCEGLSGIAGYHSTVPLSTSSCGTTQNVAWKAYYYKTSGCKDDSTPYYNQASAQVSCH